MVETMVEVPPWNSADLIIKNLIRPNQAPRIKEKCVLERRELCLKIWTYRVLKYYCEQNLAVLSREKLKCTFSTLDMEPVGLIFACEIPQNRFQELIWLIKTRFRRLESRICS